ncbi:hypothetical protein ERO13_A07G172500v2 [Gossypium hirsutum]|uniref:Transcription factor CYCLOIDEA n=1 Tax=Gossypium hirsutum TaxID=3635 RepID=A0A1U8P8Z0_GOSHI|nr:transcription factor CYCLOIDEA-like [Gossypium hirsutum]KAG4192707.1 hypothetical protein ERO13_A07G172500v2 [Gossypium hirsutum]
MFFSTSANDYNNINPFLHFPSSSYHPQALPPPPPPPPPLLSHESNGILLNHHHHHHDLVSVSSLLPANPQLTDTLFNMALLNKDGVGFGGPPGFGFPVNKAVKKDRHSKICTAQGVRDRRVRLSIEIAREFFDLQDMLGFDKASKTVEWLLRKSNNAIRELVKMKRHGNGCPGGQRSFSLVPDDQYEMVAENGALGVDGGEFEGTAFQSNLLELEGVVSKDKKMKNLHKAAVPLLAKESRAKARARARERTREKMCSGSGSSTSRHEWKICPDSSPHFLRSLSQLEPTKKSDHSYGHNSSSMASSFKVVAHQVEEPSAASRDNVIEESLVIRRMLKPSAILGFQQNLATSKDASCNSSGNNGFPNLSQKWDINGAMAHSTLCAVTTNVNLSTGVQLYGKP